MQPFTALRLRAAWFLRLVALSEKKRPARIRVTCWDENFKRLRVRVPYDLARILAVKCWGDFTASDELILRPEFMLHYREDGAQYSARVLARTPPPARRPLEPKLQLKLSCVLLERLGGTVPLPADVLDGDLGKLSQSLRSCGLARP